MMHTVSQAAMRVSADVDFQHQIVNCDKELFFVAQLGCFNILFVSLWRFTWAVEALENIHLLTREKAKSARG